jgi:hypothetical protein
MILIVEKYLLISCEISIIKIMYKIILVLNLRILFYFRAASINMGINPSSKVQKIHLFNNIAYKC